MTSESKRLATIIAVLMAAVAAFVLWPSARRQLAPEPRGACVAIEVADSGIARCGAQVELAAGQGFQLRAVLEAEDWLGRSVYYTEADRLEIDGREIDRTALRRWANGPLEARVLWFVVEGTTRYKEISSAEELAAFTFREVYRPDWPQAWTVPGSVRPSFADAVRQGSGVDWPELGTARYQVRIELYGPDSSIRPRSRTFSLGAAELPGAAQRFPTVSRLAPGPLEVPTRLLGLSQLEPAEGASRELLARLVQWTDAGLAFSRLALLQRHLRASGLDWEALVWRPVGVDGLAEVGPGDLIRSGSRVVIVLEDRGVAGRLDGEDVVLDYDHGGNPVRLGNIFRGEGGLVDLARVRSASGR
jgi:hypothetical protein